VLIPGELLEGSHFPSIDRELLEATKYAFLWAKKEMKRIHDSKIFWVLMEMNIHRWLNWKPWLSHTVYNNLQSLTDIKADMHNIFIRVPKDPTKQWMKLPFVAIKDAIFTILEARAPKWHAPNITELERATT